MSVATLAPTGRLVSDNVGRCASCREPVVWAVHVRTGKRAPLLHDPDGRWALRARVDQGREVLIYDAATPQDDDRWTSHFADCPGAARHRRSS